MAWAGIDSAIIRYNFAAIRLGWMACNTSGSILVVLTGRAAPSFKSPSTACSVGTVVLLNAMSICRMFQQGSGRQKLKSLNARGNLTFEKVDGFVVDGRSKS